MLKVEIIGKGEAVYYNDKYPGYRAYVTQETEDGFAQGVVRLHVTQGGTALVPGEAIELGGLLQAVLVAAGEMAALLTDTKVRLSEGE